MKKFYLLLSIALLFAVNVAKSQNNKLLLDFDNLVADGTTWSSGSFGSDVSSVVDNLVLDGINSSEKAMKWEKDGSTGSIYGALYFQKNGETIPFAPGDVFTFLVMGDTPITKLKVLFWDETWGGNGEYAVYDLDIPANTWGKVSIPIDSFKLAKPYIGVIGLSMGVGETEVTNYYIDDIQIESAPVVENNKLLLDFDNLVADGTTWSSGSWGSDVSSVVDNLVMDGINSSEKAMKWGKDGSTDIYGTLYFQKNTDTILVSSGDVFTFLVMGDTPITKLKVLFWDENWGGNGQYAVYDLDIPANTWGKVSMPIDSFKVAKPYIGVIGLSMGVGETEVTNYYVDDIQIEKIVTSSIHIAQKSKITMYPNPVSSTLSIKNADSYSNIEMIDASGRILLSQKNNSANIVNINVSNLNRGLYFVRLRNSTGTEIQKIIKK